MHHHLSKLDRAFFQKLNTWRKAALVMCARVLQLIHKQRFSIKCHQSI